MRLSFSGRRIVYTERNLMEYLDVVDENGNPTGKTVERSVAHRDGILHRTAHLWLVREKNGEVQILLQKRSAEKDSYPGCYDISSAGHIPAGVDYIPSLLRELGEELGISVDRDKLIYCGYNIVERNVKFRGEPFHDCEFSRIYMAKVSLDEGDFKLQKEEVESVLWMNLDECLDKVARGTIPNCIVLKELEMLKSTLSPGEKKNGTH